jgi:hypothetical protein
MEPERPAVHTLRTRWGRLQSWLGIGGVPPLNQRPLTETRQIFSGKVAATVPLLLVTGGCRLRYRATGEGMSMRPLVALNQFDKLQAQCTQAQIQS